MFVLIVVKSFGCDGLRPNCYAVKLYQQEPFWHNIESSLSIWAAENVKSGHSHWKIAQEILRNGYFCETEGCLYTYTIDRVGE
mgnify:FL=1